MSIHLLDARLPYSRAFLERVPTAYLNLQELASSAVESREMQGDVSWRIEDRSKTLALAFFRNGRPYQVVGREVTRFEDIVTWVQKEGQKHEFFLTLRFLHEGSLPYAVRCATEQPVLSRLKASGGQVAELFDSLRKRGESGLIRLSTGDSGTLVPVVGGEVLTVWSSEGASTPEQGVALLEGELPPGTEGYFYGGITEPLPAVGLAEIPIVLGAFNNWFARICGIWPEAFGISVNLFGKLREKKPLVRSLVLMPSGLSLRGAFPEPGKMPDVIIVLAKAIAKKNEDPTKCMKYFREVNMATRTVLQELGLGQLMGRGRT